MLDISPAQELENPFHFLSNLAYRHRDVVNNSVELGKIVELWRRHLLSRSLHTHVTHFSK